MTLVMSDNSVHQTRARSTSFDVLAESDDIHLDALEDMMSLDSDALHSQQVTVSSPPSSPKTSYYNPIGLTIGHTSPTSMPSISSQPLVNTRHDDPPPLHNAVHMHVQENAKLPTFNLKVDRSNSSHVSRVTPSYSKGTSQPVKDKPHLEERDLSMAELFLSKESSQRQSLNQNYEKFGSITADGIAQVRKRFIGDSVTNDDSIVKNVMDALTAAIDPTPWAEIQQKLDKKSVDKEPQNLPHGYNNHYGRHQQLPIPQRLPSPPGAAKPGAAAGDTMAQAIATAARIASTDAKKAARASAQHSSPHYRTSPRPIAPAPVPPVKPDSRPILPNLASHQARPIYPSMASTSPYTKAQQTKMAPPIPALLPGRNYMLHRPTHSQPNHSITHSQNRASVAAAAKQKSQYGFGGNHIVPSVPAPPPDPTKAKTKPIAPRTAGKPNPKKRAALTPPTQMNPPIPVLPMMTVVTNNGAAYERKKQRAKDARIKLNESIEQLSVAISLAASQSRQRKIDIHNVAMRGTRPRTLQTMDDCIKVAEQAKKWDRPSFVGTAASLIQGLNSQCEEFMREISSLQAQLAVAKGEDQTVPPAGQAANSGGKQAVDAAGGGMKNDQDQAKVKAEVCNAALNEDAIIETRKERRRNNEIIFKNVATMLDPASLARCACVCQEWHDIGAFQDENVWLNLAVRRFGFRYVRQWTEKLEDSAMRDDFKVSNKHLYWKMDGGNVMPHFQHQGWSLIGKTQLSGKVAGWVFVVERSNGETLRSVRREPGNASQGSGQFASLHVVELRLVIQNIGMSDKSMGIKNHTITVDTSTRRSGGEWEEIGWDPRFVKVAKNLDMTIKKGPAKNDMEHGRQSELCQLDLYETAVLEVFMHARGCSTISRFEQRGNFAKVLISLDGTTVPLVIPFLKNSSTIQEDR